MDLLTRLRSLEPTAEAYDALADAEHTAVLDASELLDDLRPRGYAFTLTPDGLLRVKPPERAEDGARVRIAALADALVFVLAAEARCPAAAVPVARQVLPGVALVHGLAEDYLPTLEAQSVHAVVTSPPYWKKRRYADSGDPDELGQEQVPEAFVARLVAILRPLQQVLRRDGVMLINIGDGHYNVFGGGSRTMTSGNARHVAAMGRFTPPKHPRLQRKSLVRVHSMLADGLEADGWLIRDILIWHKPNGVPHPGLKDRATTSHEYVLHLTLGPDYYWNAEAIAEPAAWERWGVQTTPKARANGPGRASGTWLKERSREEVLETLAKPTKNRRSVITLPVSRYRGEHGAVMPEALAELMVAAATPPGGVVLDPFTGAGTTAVAALRLGMTFIGCEKEAASIEEATRRLARASAAGRPLPLPLAFEEVAG